MKRTIFVLLAGSLFALGAARAQERSNLFGDPFEQVTSAVPNCPVPQPPGVTKDEMAALAHVRAQHGTSCHLSGRCRLANSYLYDKEIIPRVVQYLRLDGRFNDTSVWVLGERRLVTLMGCVQSQEQAAAMEKAIGLVDDVMGVVNQLVVGTGGTPRYAVVPSVK
ncbi:MAG: BON domain-containing protein [Ramlibacter sp.]|nr:BON domain-containing protein [Ramlibacter sp.]